MNTIHKLKSTGEIVHPLPYIGQGTQSWAQGYERVLIPNPNGKHRVQIVKKSNMSTIKKSF